MVTIGWLRKALNAVTPAVIVFESYIQYGMRNIAVTYDPRLRLSMANTTTIPVPPRWRFTGEVVSALSRFAVLHYVTIRSTAS